MESPGRTGLAEGNWFGTAEGNSAGPSWLPRLTFFPLRVWDRDTPSGSGLSPAFQRYLLGFGNKERVEIHEGVVLSHRLRPQP